MLVAGNSGEGMFAYEPIVQAAPLSVELWYWPIVNKGALYLLFAWDNATNPSIDFALSATKVLQVAINGQGLNDTSASSDQTWHHAVLTYDLANIRLYRDGSQVASQAYSVSFTISRNLGIGNEPSNGLVGLTHIAEVAIYSTALSAARVSAHFAAAEQPSQAPIYQLGGSFPQPGGGGTTNTADIQALIKYVSQTYQNTP